MLARYLLCVRMSKSADWGSRGRFVGRQNAVGQGPRRGRGGAGWCGAPCGCPPWRPAHRVAGQDAPASTQSQVERVLARENRMDTLNAPTMGELRTFFLLLFLH